MRGEKVIGIDLGTITIRAAPVEKTPFFWMRFKRIKSKKPKITEQKRPIIQSVIRCNQ